ncbi:MAG: hypothetical protein AAB933_00980 [Patescibacteria group bacterium]
MFVKIKSAPRGMDLDNLVQVSLVHIGKAIVIPDPNSDVLEIKGGDDEDIEKLKKKGITLEKI